MLNVYTRQNIAGSSVSMMDLEAVATSPMVTAPAASEAYQSWFESIQRKNPYMDPMVWPLIVVVGLASTDMGHTLLLWMIGPLGEAAQVALLLWPMWMVAGIIVWAWLTTSAVFFRFVRVRRYRHSRLMRLFCRRPFIYRAPREIGHRRSTQTFVFYEGTGWLSQWEHSQRKLEEWTAELQEIAGEVAQLPGVKSAHGSLSDLIRSLVRNTTWLKHNRPHLAKWMMGRERILTDGVLKMSDRERSIVRLRRPWHTRRVRRLVRAMRVQHERLERQVLTALHGDRRSPTS